MNSDPQRDFFKYCTLHKTLVGAIKAVKIVLIPTDSDAVFHEKSEYGVDFKIRAEKVGLSSILRKQFIFFRC